MNPDAATTSPVVLPRTEATEPRVPVIPPIPRQAGGAELSRRVVSDPPGEDKTFGPTIVLGRE